MSHAELLSHYNKRELLPLLLLAREFTSRGVVSEVQFLYSSSKRYFTPKPDISLLPFYYRDENTQNNFSRVSWHGQAVVNLCWEQMRTKWLKDIGTPKGKLIDQGLICFAWGEKFKQVLVRNEVPESQVVCSGNIRLDLYSFPELLLSRAYLAKRYNLDRDKKWLLIPWNLQQGSPGNKDIEKVCAEYGLPYPHDVKNTARLSRDHFLKLVSRLTKVLDGWEIILRAHPADKDSKTLLGAAANATANAKITVTSDFDLAHWVQACNSCLGWTTTSLIESMVAGKQTIAFEPEPFSDRYDYDLGKIVPCYSEADRVIETIRCEKDNLGKDGNYQLLHQWYGECDGKAHKRIVDTCLKLIEAEDRSRSLPRQYRYRLQPMRGILRRALQHAPFLYPLLAKVGLGKSRSEWISPVLLNAINRGESIESIAEKLI